MYSNVIYYNYITWLLDIISINSNNIYNLDSDSLNNSKNYNFLNLITVEYIQSYTLIYTKIWIFFKPHGAKNRIYNSSYEYIIKVFMQF